LLFKASPLYPERALNPAHIHSHTRVEANVLEKPALPQPLIDAAAHLARRELGKAEAILRPFLKAHPADVNAMRMLGDIGLELGALRDAENLLARCVELAPDYAAGRYSYINVLYKRHRYAQALREVERLLATDPENLAYLALKAANLVEVARHREAIELFEAILLKEPGNSAVRLSLGHALRALGESGAAVEAYRQVTGQAEHAGEAYWSLANLKTAAFSDADVDQIHTLLRDKDCDYRNSYHGLFALGKAYEDRRIADKAMAAYAQGNLLKSKSVPWDIDAFERDTSELIDFFDPALFTRFRDAGDARPDPIFIVGLPRSGSTLIEQILSSHSQVEGTAELATLIAIARSIANKTQQRGESEYPQALANMDGASLAKLGARYLSETAVHRVTETLFFIDKMPNNFSHVGLIQLILPNAKIIDARRHPLDCCFSGYKQLFASGQGFTYGQARIANYYLQYERVMQHWDTVLPGRVHRVYYEAMVQNPEREIRALLAHCGLSFEPECLSFHTTQRTVRTASSEQVRQPINDKGIGAWRPFAPWLTTLSDLLSDSVAAYPATISAD
jgi:tetratricopeptide (TPR) repeat protein